MKLFAKKPETDDLHSLNEKEIQKRLYGKYHREGNSNPNIGRSSVNTTGTPLEIPEVSRAHSFSSQTKSLLVRAGSSLFVFLKKVPWKLLGIVSAALIATVVAFQVFSFLFAKIKTLPKPVGRSLSISHLSKPAAPHKIAPRILESKKEVTVRETPKVEAVAQKMVFSQSAIRSDSPLSLPKQIETARKKYYTIQICTYQREHDARQLTEELKNADLPAYYLKILSSQQQIPHYVVFLSKEDTYAEASARLREFRKTQQFQKFSDSFVRSL